jgi:hypothetical protein
MEPSDSPSDSRGNRVDPPVSRTIRTLGRDPEKDGPFVQWCDADC